MAELAIKVLESEKLEVETLKLGTLELGTLEVEILEAEIEALGAFWYMFNRLGPPQYSDGCHYKSYCTGLHLGWIQQQARSQR